MTSRKFGIRILRTKAEVDADFEQLTAQGPYKKVQLNRPGRVVWSSHLPLRGEEATRALENEYDEEMEWDGNHYYSDF